MWRRGTAVTRQPPAKSHEYSNGHTSLLHVYSRTSGSPGQAQLYNEIYGTYTLIATHVILAVQKCRDRRGKPITTIHTLGILGRVS